MFSQECLSTVGLQTLYVSKQDNMFVSIGCQVIEARAGVGKPGEARGWMGGQAGGEGEPGEARGCVGWRAGGGGMGGR